MRPYLYFPRTGDTSAEALLGQGVEHHAAGRRAEAEAAYRAGLRLEPNHPGLVCNMGVLAAEQGMLVLALQRLERALLFHDGLRTIWHDYAQALLEAQRADEARDAIARALALDECAASWHVRAAIASHLGDAAGMVKAYERALALDPAHPSAGHNLIYARSFLDGSPADDLEARRRWWRAHRWKGARAPHANDRTPGRRLRVGYVAGDFRLHSAAFTFARIILDHDSTRVEPYCYMTLKHAPGDAWTQKFQKAAAWRDISDLDDGAAEAMIRADGIDILVDLSGHTYGNRLPLFTRKPAPVQATGWGLTGTGIAEIDWLFSDRFIIPAAARHWYVEKVADLPCFFSYAPPDYDLPGVTPPPAGQHGAFTFGVYGRFEKMGDASLEAWRRILEAVPGSRLLLKDTAFRRPYAIRRVRAALRGIDPGRVLFLEQTSHPEQMEAYQYADLVLDTFPQTGGLGAMEILYMGVPMVTLCGAQPPARAGAAILRAIGRERWVAHTVEEYVALAASLAAERQEVAAARRTLRDEVLSSPLCAPDYCRHVEAAYAEMWRQHCAAPALAAE